MLLSESPSYDSRPPIHLERRQSLCAESLLGGVLLPIFSLPLSHSNSIFVR